VFPRDEHTGGRRRHLLDALDHLLHAAAPAHDLVLRVHLGLEPDVLTRQIEVLQGVAQRKQDAVGVERLLEEVVGAELRRLDRGLDGPVAGDHHHLGPRVELAELAQRLEPVHALHLDVQEDEMRAKLGVAQQRFRPRRARLHFDLFVLEDLLKRLANALLVVHHQDPPVHELLRRYRYSTTPVGWIATSTKAGETRSGTAPVESAPATRWASCFTSGPGNGKPRSDSSWTVKCATPGRSIRRGPAIRSGSMGLSIPARGPIASGGMTRVSNRQ